MTLVLPCYTPSESAPRSVSTRGRCGTPGRDRRADDSTESDIRGEG